MTTFPFVLRHPGLPEGALQLGGIDVIWKILLEMVFRAVALSSRKRFLLLPWDCCDLFL